MGAPPIPKSAETIEGALADLAGAVEAAIQMAMETPDAEVSESMFFLFVAAAQWRNSGFEFDAAQEVAENILNSRSRAREKHNK